MFEYHFMQNAFLSGTMIACICGLMSIFIILRRNVFATHALAHTSLTGAAGAVLIGLSALTGQLMVNIAAAVIIGLLGDKVRKNDLVVGIVLSFFLGLGAYFLFLYNNSYTGSVMSILFGNILTVSSNQITALCYLSSMTLVFLLITMRPLLFSSIDPTLARSKKLPQKLLNISFSISLAITISMACQIVGTLLLFALMIAPGAIAAQWCKQFSHLLALSTLLAVITVWVSLTWSFYMNLPNSFCITMILTLAYFLSLIKTKIFPI